MTAPAEIDSEEALFLEVRVGGPIAGAAMRQLVERVRRVLASIAQAILGNPEDVDDAVQTTYLEILKGAESFALGRPFRPWLLLIHRNVCLKIKRRRRRKADRAAASLPEEDPPHEVDGPSTEVRKRDLHERIRRDLARLPDPEREVLALRYFGALGVNETAALLGIKEGTVRAWTAQGRERLRALWRDELGMEDGHE